MENPMHPVLVFAVTVAALWLASTAGSWLRSRIPDAGDEQEDLGVILAGEVAWWPTTRASSEVATERDNSTDECLCWVKNGSDGPEIRLPLLPQQRT
jgi:hypothetical protein